MLALLVSYPYLTYTQDRFINLYYNITCKKDVSNMEDREIKGMAIIAKGDLPKELSKETFVVPSQSGAGNYQVSHVEGWTCSCPDYVSRHVECKHIKATQFFLKLRNKTEVENFPIEETIPQENDNKECPYCKSKEIVKNGARKTSAGTKQRFKCLACKKRFVLTPIKYVKADAKIVVLTLDLYYKGLSLRDISDTIFQFYNQKIHFDTIRRWINKYTNQINKYAEKLAPQTGTILHTDEQFLKNKGKQVFAYNTIDEKTRFVLASTLTKNRGLSETRRHFKEVREQLSNKPEMIITDKLFSYRKAIKKEFPIVSQHHKNTEGTRHISIVGQRKMINNNLIERYHNDFREFDKVRRGFKNFEATQNYLNGHKIYHNFIHKNPIIKTTPAEKAGLGKIEENNKWLGLIKQANINTQNLQKV